MKVFGRTENCLRVQESESEVAQSCPTLCDLMDCSLSGSSVHGIFQARVLEWIAISFSRGSRLFHSEGAAGWRNAKLSSRPPGLRVVQTGFEERNRSSSENVALWSLPKSQEGKGLGGPPEKRWHFVIPFSCLPQLGVLLVSQVSLKTNRNELFTENFSLIKKKGKMTGSNCFYFPALLP